MLMVFQLVYTSKAVQEFWPDDLLALVEKARTKNAPRGITGMLLFHDDHFLQLLEGPELAVCACFNVIKTDPRHTGVRVLLSGTEPGRAFPDWTMGFERMEDAWNVPRAWTTILEEDLAPGAGSSAKELLLSFGHGLGTPPR